MKWSLQTVSLCCSDMYIFWHELVTLSEDFIKTKCWINIQCLCDSDGEFFSATVQVNKCSNILDVMKNLSSSFEVTVEPTKLLCIANLPTDYTDTKLHQHLAAYGNITRCFMFRCPDTGMFTIEWLDVYWQLIHWLTKQYKWLYVLVYCLPKHALFTHHVWYLSFWNILINLSR